MSDNGGATANYVIEMVFEGDDTASALAKANAWLTLQGSAVELQTVVGDQNLVSIYYNAKAKAAPASPKLASLGSGSISVVGPGEYTTTNGA